MRTFSHTSVVARSTVDKSSSIVQAASLCQGTQNRSERQDRLVSPVASWQESVLVEETSQSSCGAIPWQMLIGFRRHARSDPRCLSVRRCILKPWNHHDVSRATVAPPPALVHPNRESSVYGCVRPNLVFCFICCVCSNLRWKLPTFFQMSWSPRCQVWWTPE